MPTGNDIEAQNRSSTSQSLNCELVPNAGKIKLGKFH